MNRVARAGNIAVSFGCGSRADRGDVRVIAAEALVAEFQTSRGETERAALGETSPNGSVIGPDEFIIEDTVGPFPVAE